MSAPLILQSVVAAEPPRPQWIPSPRPVGHDAFQPVELVLARLDDVEKHRHNA